MVLPEDHDCLKQMASLLFHRTYSSSVILDLLHLYLKNKSESRWRALEDVAWPPWGMRTSQKNKKCNCWHRWYRKDQEDVPTSSSYRAFLFPRKTLGSLLQCMNNKRTGTFVSLKQGFCKTTDFWLVKTWILMVHVNPMAPGSRRRSVRFPWLNSCYEMMWPP